jgi:hypothetical protein
VGRGAGVSASASAQRCALSLRRTAGHGGSLAGRLASPGSEPARVARRLAAGPPLAELRRFLSNPCFVWARFSLGATKPDSAASLRTWWVEYGYSWLSTTAAQPSSRRVTLPPDFRPSLFLAGHEHETLTPLLCASSDARCGAETRGWLLRAQEAFDRHDDFYESIPPDDLASPPGRKEWHEAGPVCDAQAAAAKPADRLATWRDCIDNLRPVVARLPVGRFRAPTRGWLIIAGRRGHYAFCDGVAAYDLATGAASAVRSCSTLVLANGGFVDGAKTNAARRNETDSGTVSVDNLRELTLMLLLLEHGTRLAASADEGQLPPNVTVPTTAPPRLQQRGGSGFITSGDTLLSWRWIDGARTLASGELRWPGSSRAEEAHADQLLEILEAGLSPGCAPAAPPALAAGGNSGAVSPIDADPADRAVTYESLRRSFEKAHAACGTH